MQDFAMLLKDYNDGLPLRQLAALVRTPGCSNIPMLTLLISVGIML